MCLEYDPLLLLKKTSKTRCAGFYGGTSPRAESHTTQAASPQNEHDAECAEPVA